MRAPGRARKEAPRRAPTDASKGGVRRARDRHHSEFRTTFEQTAVGIAHIGTDGRFLRVNRRFCEMLGYPREELVGEMFTAFTQPEDQESSQEMFRQICSGEIETCKLEKRDLHKDGRSIWVELNASAAKDAAGKAVYLITVVQDISERKEADLKLDYYSSRLARLVELESSLSDSGRKLDDVMTLVAQEACALTGASSAAIQFVEQGALIQRVATGDANGLPERIVHIDKTLAGAALQTGSALLCEDTEATPQIDMAEARRAGLRAAVVAPMRAEGAPLGVLGIYSPQPGSFSAEDLRIASLLADIAGSEIHRRRSEQALRDSEARFRGLTRLSSDWYWELDAEGRFTEVSGRLPEGAGIGGEDMLGRDRWDMFGMGVAPADRKAVDDAIAARQSFNALSFPVVLADGQTRHLELSGEPTFDTAGNFAGYRGVGRDVSPRLLAAAELNAALRFSRMTLDALTKHICVIDESGTILAVNRAWQEFARANSAVHPHVSEGCNYLAVCDAVQGADATEAATFARGARLVLSGEHKEFRMEYACHSPDEQRWFMVRVTRFDDDGPVRAVVAHESITARKRHEDDLRRFRFAMDSTVDGIFLIDPLALRFIDINHTACVLMGYSRDELLAMRPGETVGFSTDEMARQFRELIDAGEIQTLEQVHRRRDGALIPTETIRRPVNTERGWIVVTTVRDIIQRKQAEEAVRRHARQQGLIAAFGQQALASTDLVQLFEDAVIHACDGLDVEFSRLLQLAPDARSLVVKAGCGWATSWIGWRTPESGEAHLYTHVLNSREPVIVEDFRREARLAPSEMLTAHGIISALEVLIAGAGGCFGTLGVFSQEPHRFSVDDVDFLQSIANIVETAVERKRDEERLAQLSQFDLLTGLPNRTLLRDRLDQALTQAQRNEWQLGVMVVDLDHFKVINDTLGHAAGDVVLGQMAERLQGVVRSGDTVARLSADEFAIVLPKLARPDDAGRVAQKIKEACGPPFEVEGQTVYITASVGVALFPGDGSDASGLLGHANSAVHRAKEQGRDNCQFYLPQMNERAMRRMQTEAALRGALERDEFVLHYQPKADLFTGAICGFEALMRWQHPERGLVPPGDFIAVLEDTGLIVPAGAWAIRSVCRQIVQWQADDMKALPVAVNLSSRQFQQKDFESVVGDIIRETGVDPHLLELELTESLLMHDAQAAAQTLRNLKSLGVRLAVDDFGTGYSSLAYLKRFPLDSLKIDRAFIRDCTTDPEDAMIASAVISLAHSLKLNVVAEGVETEEQLNFLRSHGCDQIQGFYFARPLAIEVATKALANNTRLKGTAYDDNAQARTLLLVDDNADDLELNQLNFSTDGYRILRAESPQAALDALANHRVDAVISDQNMPRMSGADFLVAVRKLYPEVIRIILSGSDDPALLPKAVNEAGIHSFLSKHWDAERLRQSVRQVFQSTEKPDR